MSLPENNQSESTIESNTAPNTQPPAPPPPGSDAPAAKKRGRPSNAERAAREAANSTAEQIESGGAASAPAASKKASANRKKISRDDVGALANQLVGIHTVAAMATGVQEIAISDKEGLALANGIIAVCEEYGLSISGKTGAALQLLGAAAMIYGPRVFAVKMRMDKQAAQRKAQQEANTFEMGPNGSVNVPSA